MAEKIGIDVDAQALARGLIDRNEIEVRPGLTIVYCETINKHFVRESLDRLEDLPPSIIKEVDDFLLSRKQRTG